MAFNLHSFDRLSAATGGIKTQSRNPCVYDARKLTWISIAVRGMYDASEIQVIQQRVIEQRVVATC